MEWLKKKVGWPQKPEQPRMIIAAAPRIVNVLIQGGVLTKIPYIIRSIGGNILPDGEYMLTINLEVPLENAGTIMVENYMAIPVLVEEQYEEQRRDTKLPNSGVV